MNTIVKKYARSDLAQCPQGRMDTRLEVSGGNPACHRFVEARDAGGGRGAPIRPVIARPFKLRGLNYKVLIDSSV